MKNNYLCIIQARVGSTRLPNKVLMKVNNIPLLQYEIERVKMSKNIDKIVVATGDDKENNKIQELCKRIGIDCFRGSESDVLNRFYKCSLKYPKYKNIIRITGDCPLIDPAVIDNVISFYKKNNFDYVSNALKPTYPDGMDTEVFSREVLEESNKESLLMSEREHVTLYIRRNKKYKKGNLEAPENYGNIRLTIDSDKDYRVIKFLIQNSKITTEYKKYIELLKDNPNIMKINMNIARNEGLKKSIKNDYKIKKIFQKDNFSNSRIEYKRINQNFRGILDKYFDNYKVKGTYQLNRNEINSENYKIIIEHNKKIKTILLRKHKFLKSISQINFYLNLLNKLHNKSTKVVSVVRAKKNELCVSLDKNFYSIFEFIESDYFKPSVIAFKNLAKAISKMHLTFDSFDNNYLLEIKKNSRKSKAYFNVIKRYSKSDFIKIKDIILDKKNKNEIDKIILEKIPLFLSIIESIETNKRYIRAQRSVIHSDLHPHNVLINNNKINAIMDFDSIRIEDQGIDIAMAIYRFARQFFVENPDLDKKEAIKLRNLFINEYCKIKKLNKREINNLPILLKDEFLRKLLLVLNGVYIEKNNLWINDLLKFVVAFEEIDYFWS